jgi:GMP synthase (glutamine-hydrolysing)
VETIRASTESLSNAAGQADGLIFSGSPRDAWADDPLTHRLISVARESANQGKPLLGVCFGHQLLARAFGGNVQRHPVGWEVGETTVNLTPAAMASPIFAGMPQELHVIESHRDAVLSLPPGGELLAGNEHTPIQAFGIGRNVFGVQFHPEMSGDLLRHLWSDRRDRVRGEVDFDLDERLDSAGRTPEAERIFENFASIVRQ